MPSTRSMRTPAPTDLAVLPAGFLSDFVQWFPSSLERFNALDEKDQQEENWSSWARDETLQYIRNVRRDVPFALVYKIFLNTLDMVLNEGSTSSSMAEKEKEREKARVEAVQFMGENQTKPRDLIFTADGEITNAEWEYGRKQFNSILFREYDRWFDAFVAEAEEDVEGFGWSGEERFARHCAQILSKKVGLRDSDLVPVVNAWLYERSS